MNPGDKAVEIYRRKHVPRLGCVCRCVDERDETTCMPVVDFRPPAMPIPSSCLEIEQKVVTHLEHHRQRRAVALGFAIGWIVICAFAGALLSLGCASAPAKVIERPVIVTKIEKCSGTPAPIWESIPDPTVCAKNFSCFPTAVAAALSDNIDRLRAWARQVDELCAPKGTP